MVPSPSHKQRGDCHVGNASSHQQHSTYHHNATLLLLPVAVITEEVRSQLASTVAVPAW